MAGNQGPQPAVPDPKWNSFLVEDTTISGGYGMEKILARGQDSSGH